MLLCVEYLIFFLLYIHRYHEKKYEAYMSLLKCQNEINKIMKDFHEDDSFLEKILSKSESLLQ